MTTLYNLPVTDFGDGGAGMAKTANPAQTAAPNYGQPPTQVGMPQISQWYNPTKPGNQVPNYGPAAGDQRPWSQANGGFSYGDYNDPYNAYLSSIPVMQQAMQQNIGGAMAAAGGTGTRYGSAAFERAGQIGAQASLQQNQMLNELMFNQANRDLDRQFQTIPLQMQMGQMIEQGTQNRLGALSGFGQWEQGRMDDFSKMAYEDFERNKYGLLPLLLQAAQSQGAGSPGSPPSYMQIQTSPGSPPDYDPGTIVEILRTIFG